MNGKYRLTAAAWALLLLAAQSLRAQSGCVDSPEDPTLVLALIAGVGAMATGIWRARTRRR